MIKIVDSSKESESLKLNKSVTEESHLWNKIQWNIIVKKWKQQEKNKNSYLLKNIQQINNQRL